MTEKTTNIDKDSPQELFPEGDSIGRFVRVFEASAHRWELVIYPFMLAFGVIAASGFFLIYSLSKDIHYLAEGMDPEMGKHLSHITESVNYLSDNMSTMTRRIYHMSESMETMADRMGTMEYMEPMLVNMNSINHSAGSMNHTVYSMIQSMEGLRYELGDMNNSMKQMDNMNDFMP